MRHARAEALDALDDVLERLRAFDELREKSRGVFYVQSKAFLHFHEDPAGLFADVRLDGAAFTRLRVSTKRERAALLRQVRAAVRGSA